MAGGCQDGTVAASTKEREKEREEERESGRVLREKP